MATEKKADFFSLAAEEQTRGRGRMGRPWFSPAAKGLCFSVLFWPQKITPAQMAPVTLAVAVALAGVLRAVCQQPVKVKWPNDLLLGGKKIAGILTELRGSPEKTEHLVVGVGLNINQAKNSFPREIQEKATSLLIESGRLVDRTMLLIKLHQALVEAYRLFTLEGFAPFHAEWKNLSASLGQKVSVKMPGGLTITGQATKLDLEGALYVKDEKQTIHRLPYGEIL